MHEILKLLESDALVLDFIAVQISGVGEAGLKSEKEPSL